MRPLVSATENLMVELAMPEAETAFSELIEQKYRQLGVSEGSPLFRFYVEVSGPQGYVAGQRVRREISSLISVSNKQVLDVGCSVGGSLVALAQAGAACVGIDINQDDLRLCQQRLKMHRLEADVLCADAFHLPFDDQRFDVVICTEVLEHIKDRQALIGELSRVLKPGGLLYVTFPNLLSVHNLWRDPHYHLFGVTWMPLSLAGWYTRKRRGSNYDVEILPIPSAIAKLCARHGVKAYVFNASEEVLLKKLDAPESIRAGAVKRVAALAKALRLHHLLKLAVKVRSNTLPSGVLVGFKQ